LELQHNVPPFIVVVVYNYRIAHFAEVFLYQLAQRVNLGGSFMKKYEKPVIQQLSERFAHTKQCKMFGMPKKSCKSLPSGTFRLKKK